MRGQQLERTVAFQFDAFSWHIRQKEAKIDMKHLSISMQHDVSIMTILHLNDIHHQRIGSQTFSEVLLGIDQVVRVVHLKKLFQR